MSECQGIVTSIEPWGLLIAHGGDVLSVHQTELSWSAPFTHSLHYQVGDEVRFARLSDEIGSVRRLRPQDILVERLRHNDQVEAAIVNTLHGRVILKLSSSHLVDFGERDVRAAHSRSSLPLYVVDVISDLSLVYFGTERTSEPASQPFVDFIAKIRSRKG